MAGLPPTYDTGQVGLSPSGPSVSIADQLRKDPFAMQQSAEDLEIVMSLQSYWNEADANRKSGLNPRDDKWRDNLNLYWNRYDWSKKAQWQARETMPEVPSYVDRFAAALKEALVATPEGFYTVTDPADAEGDIALAVKRMTDVLLTQTNRSPNGQLLPFSSFFEEQMKLGALTVSSAVVTWKNDVKDGRVATETVDPRFVWLDHTGRNMYRIRRVEVDRHTLEEMYSSKDSKGKPLFNLPNMESLTNSLTLYDQVYKQEMAGHGVFPYSAGRAPITLDEYIATAVDQQGNVIADRSLMVVANQKFLIRGPEANPFWHGQDWLVYTPLVPTPLSVYGRTYMEDFASVAKTFTELTNLILDAVYTTSLKAWVMAPGALLDPTQVADGISPHKVFLIDDGVDPKMFAQELELGSLPPESVQTWTLLKNELSEAADMNEIGLGQFAPKGRTSATEVNATQQSSSAIIRSVAHTVEIRFLDIILDLIWKTGLQHIKANNPRMAAAVGQDMWTALWAQRKALIQRPFTFQARGLTNAIFKQQQYQKLLQLFQIIGSVPQLAQLFFQMVSLQRFVEKLFEFAGIDMHMLKATDREQAIQQIAGQYQQASQNAQQGPGGQKQVSGPGQAALGNLAQMFNTPGRSPTNNGAGQ